MIEFNVNCQVGGQAMLAQMVYTDEDPAVVLFVFYNKEAEDGTEWYFARDLLKEVLEDGESGLGDVKFYDLVETIVMSLNSPEGEGRAEFSREIIEEFAECIYEEVPEGEDSYDFPDEVYEEWLEVWSE